MNSATLALVLAFVIPAWNNLAMFTIPLFGLLPRFKEQPEATEGQAA